MLDLGEGYMNVFCIILTFLCMIFFFFIEGRNHVGKTSEEKSKKRLSNKNYTEFNQLKLAMSQAPGKHQIYSVF